MIYQVLALICFALVLVTSVVTDDPVPPVFLAIYGFGLMCLGGASA